MEPAHFIYCIYSNRRAARHVMKAMPDYHCFFLDAADQVTATLTISSTTDSEAQSRADRMLASSNHAAVEIWFGCRSVYRSRKPGFYPTLK
jgi:hypothetical protein